MADEWVQFWSSLCKGANRGIPRACRFVLMELSTEARRGHGVIPLGVGMSDEDAVCDTLGGDRGEVLEALKWFTSGLDPTMVFAGPASGRCLVIVRWGEHNSTVEKHKSSPRVERLRARKEELLRSVGIGGPPENPGVSKPPAVQGELPLLSSPVPPEVDHGSGRVRAETEPTSGAAPTTKREDEVATEAEPTAHERNTPTTEPAETDLDDAGVAILTELRAHPPLKQIATPAMAQAVAGWIAASAKRLEHVRQDIKNLALKAGAVAAVDRAWMPEQLATTLSMFVAQPARASPRAPPASGVRRRGFEAQGGPIDLAKYRNSAARAVAFPETDGDF